jgi:phage FluMu gp28-like protein
VQGKLAQLAGLGVNDALLQLGHAVDLAVFLAVFLADALAEQREEGDAHQVAGSKWSCHHVDIHEAVAAGLPVDVDELREALDDPDGWAQEYELNFLDQATVLLPYEVIVPCENLLATATVDPAFWAAGKTPVYCGIDFGRTRDLTVCWSVEMIGGAFRMTKEVLELARMSTPEQLEVLRPRLRRATRVCLDYTGPGIGLGDLMVAPKEGFGEYNPEEHKFGKVELCQFTNKLKLEIFPSLRVAFEQKLLGIPVSRVIREDLHSVSRVATAGGGVTYKAPHTKDGHADRCTALALCMRAAGKPKTASIIIPPSGVRERVVNERRNRSISA